MSVGYAKALYDFVSEHPEDVALKAGDIVQVLQQVDGSWLKGKNHNKVGYFPFNYVETLRLPAISSGQRLYLAIRSFQGGVEGDLSFDEGSIIVGLDRIDDNWWHGSCSGVSGIFPLTHVVELNEATNIWNPNRISSAQAKYDIVGLTATAVNDLTAQLDDELSFRRGDIITILHDLGDGFAIGQCGERVGQFPMSFVELCSTSCNAESQNQPVKKQKSVAPLAPSAVQPVAAADTTRKKTHSRKSSYTLLNTRSRDSSVAPYCSTLYPFAGNDANGELSFGVGEIVHLISHVSDDWLYGELDNRYGIFPTSYVDIIVDCTISTEDGCHSNVIPTAVAVPVSPGKETYGRIRYDFHPAAGSFGEIDVSEGDTVTVLEKVGGDWLQVRHDDGRIGLCPTAYVELFGCEPSQNAAAGSTPPTKKPRPPVKPRTVSANSSPKFLSSNQTSTTFEFAAVPSTSRLASTKQSSVHSAASSPVHNSRNSLPQTPPGSANIRQTLEEMIQSELRSASTKSHTLQSVSSCPWLLQSTVDNAAVWTDNGGGHVSTSSVSTRDAVVNGLHNASSPVKSLQPTRPAMPPRPVISNITNTVRPKRDLIQFSPDNADALDFASFQADQISSSISQVDNKAFDCGSPVRQQEARSKVISELYQTEVDFCSCLELCLSTFRDSTDCCFPTEDVGTLFNSVDTVVALSKRLIARLDVEVLQKLPSEQNVGDCFLALKEDIQKVYAPYCRNHDIVIAVLEKYESNEEMMSFINRKLSLMRQQMTVFDLSSILIKPVQRILKYPLLLSELLKATEDTHCDKQNLSAAVAAMTEVAAAINEYKRRKDLVLKYKRETEAKFSDKIGRLSVHSTKKKFFRISQKMAGIQTVDERFNFEEQQFKMLELNVRSLIQDVSLYFEQLEESLSSAENLAGDIRDLYAEKSADVDEFCAAHGHMVARLFTQFKSDVDREVIPPLNSLLLMFQGPSNVIRKRHDKLLDYDNASKRLGLKDHEHLSSTNEELLKAKTNYEALNAQLLDDLPKLYTLSSEIVLEVLYRYIRLQASFHSHVVEALQNCLGLQMMLVPGSSIVLTNTIEQFNSSHAAAVEHLSKISLIPTNFNSSGDETRRAKSRPTNLTDMSEGGTQTDEQKTFVLKTYRADQLFTVPQDVTASLPFDLSLKKGCIVGVIKQGDPMGNKDRWYVDTGSSKGFVPKQSLSPYQTYSNQPVDLLSWSDPVPSKSSQPASSTHDSSLWSNELFNLLDPVLSPTSSAPSAATLPSPLSAAGVSKQSAVHPSWEQFTDDSYSSKPPLARQQDARSTCGGDLGTLIGVDLWKTSKDPPAKPVASDKFRVMFTFTARDSSELSLTEGSTVQVLQKSDLDGNAEWWLVAANGQTGYAPANYLRPV